MSAERYLNKNLGGLTAQTVDVVDKFYQRGSNMKSYRLVTPVTGDTVTLSVAPEHTIIVPSGTLATLTLSFPTSAIDGTVLTITCSQTITTLTATGSAFLANSTPPATITAGTTLKYMYIRSLNKWINIQN